MSWERTFPIRRFSIRFFSAEGIEIELQEPHQYERFQIGITANPAPDWAEIWVNRIEMRIAL